LILVTGIGYFTQNWILALTTGAAHASHLLQDMRANQVRILGYSLISRYFCAFEQLDFCGSKPS
jgi:NADH:ubiquinone oxidoreductase subunit 6 (subunit J)